MASRRTKPKPKPRVKPKAHEFRDLRGGKPVERIALADPAKSPTSHFWFLPYFDPGGVVNDARRAAFRMMVRDPIVKAGLFGKVLGVAALDYQIQPTIEESPRDKEAADFLRHVVDRIPGGMPQLVQTLLMGTLIDGYQAAEKVRTVERTEARWRGKIVLDDVKAKPCELYEPIVDSYANVTGIKGRGENEGELWPISEFIWTRYLPLYDNPLGNSDLDAAYGAHWLEDTVTKLRATHAEKFVSPMMIGETANEDQKPEMEAALEKARSRTWMVIPTGAKVYALELAKQGEADFKSFVADCQKRKLIAINGAYLHILESAPQVERGNSTVAKSTSELFQWILLVIAQEAVNKQLFPELIAWNYGGMSCPRVSFGGVNEDDVKKIVDNLTGLQALGFDLDKKDVSRRTGYQAATTKEAALVRPPVTVPTATPGFPAFREPAKISQRTTPPAYEFADIPRDEVALAGKDGKQAAKLLGRAKDQGSKTLYYLARRAVARMLADSNPASATYFFDDAELLVLQNQLAAVNGTANLLGRARIRERAEQADLRHKGIMTFSEDDCFAMFADAPPPLPPGDAVEYFKALVPSLDVTPERFGPLLRREAFTLAYKTDLTMLDRVKSIIAEGLETGQISGRTQAIEDVLTRAGVAPASPQYSEMVMRTNMMESYNQGAQQELQTEQMREYFPVWQYLGIDDDRQGEDHAPHNDKFYPNNAAFSDVRGPRIFNCRCSFRAIDRYEWEDLQSQGAQVETSWGFSEESKPKPKPTPKRTPIVVELVARKNDTKPAATEPAIPMADSLSEADVVKFLGDYLR